MAEVERLKRKETLLMEIDQKFNGNKCAIYYLDLFLGLWHYTVYTEKEMSRLLTLIKGMDDALNDGVVEIVDWEFSSFDQVLAERYNLISSQKMEGESK